MKHSIKSYFAPLYWLGIVGVMALSACNDDEEQLPITDDLRVLKVNVNGDRQDDGAMDVSVISEIELTFSNALNPTAFETAFSIIPTVALDFSYDETGSIVTISPTTRLEYDTEYIINLPAGTYGANGEATIEDYSYNLSAIAFAPPTIALSAEETSFFEGETITITATIDEVIFDEVTFDLVLSGTAEGDGVDYTASATNLVIAAGETSTSFTISATTGDALEGEETISVSLSNVTNALNEPAATLSLTLGDTPPKLELVGVMELDNYIDGSGGRVRAIHLNVLEDIADLSAYHIQIASNGAAPDPLDIDFEFPADAATAGDQLFIVRDADAALAATYFGACYNDFTEFQTAGMTHNGDDAILLYENDVAIESYGEPGVDGTGLFWEYTDSWAYKSGGEWIYPGVDCVENAVGEATNETSMCQYPFCQTIELVGVGAILWDGSGTNGGKFVQVRANRAIADLSQYSLGVANNGGGTDGIEFTFPAEAVEAGDHILVAREPETIASYLGNCYNGFDKVYQADAMSQNGDDAIELFDGSTVIETYGDANVDGTGQNWEYAGSWGYKVGKWTYGGVDCAAGSTSSESSTCPYAFCTSE